MSLSHLVKVFPSLDRSLPVAPLGRFPTPVEVAPRLARALDVVSILVKRDDLSGELYGGNKVRKLELLYGRALEERRGWVVTTGAWGSHHVLATAIFGRMLGVRVGAVLVPQPPTEHVLDTLLCTAANGTSITAVSSAAAVTPTLALEAARRRAMIIWPGGSSPLGALAFTAAAFELAEQILRGECPEPSRIYVALGSSGTHAGLLLGLRLAGLDCELIGVRVTDRPRANEHTVARLATMTSRLLHRLAPEAPRLSFASREVSVLHDQFGAGYGFSTNQGEEAIELAREKAGIQLDSTYTGKAMAGLISDVRARPPEGPVLFWNTLSSVDLDASRASATPDMLPQALRKLYR
jgi:1-aminocyclopropane-1-carboxylate deaminase/D-cysteine desulfhydrase-like pyridoxal-dependent ACC family enzyme